MIRVERFEFTKDATRSRYYVNGVLFGYGVEDEIRSIKVKGETAIPFGKYELRTRLSPRFSQHYYYSEKYNKLIPRLEYNRLREKEDFKAHELIWIYNVPNFEYVLIHWGNTDDDTDGCYIVGDGLGIVNNQPGVINSRINYKKLYEKVYKEIKKGGKFIEFVRV